MVAAPGEPADRALRSCARAGALLVAVALATTLVSGGLGGAAAAAGRRSAVAAFFPLAEVLRAVGGPRLEVADLTPGGSEPHGLELTPGRRDLLETADLAVVVGRGFQPDVEAAARARDGRTVVVLPRLAARGRRAPQPGDPHFWLDPHAMVEVTGLVEHALRGVDPGGATGYEQRAEDLRTRLDGLDAEFRQGLAACARRLVVTAHEAFGWLARRYGLEQLGVSGISPDAEPGPGRLAQLADLARNRGVTTIFTETLVSPKVSETLAREAGGLRTNVLDPLEGLTAAKRRAGADYFSVMRDNLARLRRALDCS